MRFVDQPMPEEIPGYPCVSTPVWSTTLTEVASGAESANQNWSNPRWRFRLPAAIRDYAAITGLYEHWLTMGGPFHLWPFRDPHDFASVALECPNEEPAITALDQIIGTTEEYRTEYQLVKRYTRGPKTLVRAIELPVMGSVALALDGIDPLDYTGGPFNWTVSREGGLITFDEAPPPGLVLTAGYLFDVPVRFQADDTFDQIVIAYGLSQSADLVLESRRLC